MGNLSGIRKGIADNIREICKEKGIKQKDIAEYLGNTSFTTHLPCLVVTCTKCGHVDLFSILTLDKEQDDE